MLENTETGLVQVYTGNSKGKTTAALGLALRAVGHGYHVCIIQFLKGSTYTGELYSAERLYPNIKIYQFGKSCPYASLIKAGVSKCKGCGACFIKKDGITHEDVRIITEAVAFTKKVIVSDEYQIVILDEISHAVNTGLLSSDDVLKIIDKKSQKVELVLTGRQMPQPIIDRADLVTEMVEIKHPFSRGAESRRGIEY